MSTYRHSGSEQERGNRLFSGRTPEIRVLKASQGTDLLKLFGSEISEYCYYKKINASEFILKHVIDQAISKVKHESELMDGELKSVAVAADIKLVNDDYICSIVVMEMRKKGGSQPAEICHGKNVSMSTP